MQIKKWVSQNNRISQASRTRLEETVNTEIQRVIDQCCVLVARAETGGGFGHAAEHLTHLTCMHIYARGLGGIQRNWQMPTLVISSIDVMPSFQRKGVFAALCDSLIDHCAHNNWVLKVENVLVPHLRKHLEHRGFLPCPNAHGTELEHGSLYWLPKPEVRDQLPRLDMSRMSQLRNTA